jgi:hypothetical protein
MKLGKNAAESSLLGAWTSLDFETVPVPMGADPEI